jgi:hypothetical protein
MLPQAEAKVEEGATPPRCYLGRVLVEIHVFSLNVDEINLQSAAIEC